MQKRKKARVISTAMAAVVLIGVCSDFRLSFTGDKNAAQENILDIAATGAITYASESGGAIGKSCLVSAMIDAGSIDGRGRTSLCKSFCNAGRSK